jgi:hypothetical protein
MKNRFIFKSLSIVLVLIAFQFKVKSQAAINGIINSYAPVTAINTSNCPNVLTVGNTTGFAVGNKILIIQMKGAKFDTANVSTFGNIINLNGAGSYEMAKITSIVGNQVTLNGALSNSYDVNGKVQMVLVPFYMNANINGLLTCQPWNGTTGGVLIFEVQSNLFFNADIDVSGTGFRGGNISNNPDGSCGSGSYAYHYPLTQPSSWWSEGGAEKGEGISEIDSMRLAGRGPLVNGGGGGNKHNTGGGGGSNFTAGGIGGNELGGCPIGLVAGMGGKDLSSYYMMDKIFAGGGGGCGDYNNWVGSNGENGGGIAIISAKAITGNNYKVKANGNDVIVVGSGIADGAGGGGGGGTVFLNSTLVTGLNVEAKGGRGGDQNPTWGCVGPGGGGGTGILLTNMATLSGVSYTLTPGTAGLFLNPSFPSCYNTTYGAAPGATNTIGPLTNMSLILTQDSITSCGGVGITQYAKNTINLVVYPDPANSYIAWKANTNGSDIETVKIYDCFGRMVFEARSKQEVSNLNNKINIEKLEGGVYFLEFNCNTNSYRERFVKTD